MTLTRIRTSLTLVAAFALILMGAFLIASQSAYANETPGWDLKTVTTPAGPSFATCPNLKGWYDNPDEQGPDQVPTPTEAGLKFTDKNLIHHATSGIDLADMDHVTTSFVATTAGKVVFKVETSAPYSTIITNADGKLWSTAMTYDQEGGQGHPVAHYSDLVGKPTKPGKAPFTSASTVVTFGVGYWVEEGSTVVSSISFHGTTYPLTCVQHTATAPVPSASTSTKPVHSGVPSHSASTTHPGGAATGGGTSGTGSALAITGPPVGFIAGGAAVLLAAGGALIYATRRRRTTFSA